MHINNSGMITYLYITINDDMRMRQLEHGQLVQPFNLNQSLTCSSVGVAQVTHRGTLLDYRYNRDIKQKQNCQTPPAGYSQISLVTVFNSPVSDFFAVVTPAIQIVFGVQPMHHAVSDGHRYTDGCW